jgi:hypothetical protein
LRADGRCLRDQSKEDVMGLGKGALLWIIGIPLPIVLLLVFLL